MGLKPLQNPDLEGTCFLRSLRLKAPALTGLDRFDIQAGGHGTCLEDSLGWLGKLSHSAAGSWHRGQRGYYVGLRRRLGIEEEAQGSSVEGVAPLESAYDRNWDEENLHVTGWGAERRPPHRAFAWGAPRAHEGHHGQKKP